MQARRNGERGIHAHHAGIEVELRNAFQTTGRTFFNAHAAAFAVVDQNLVHAVRPLGTRDAGLGTNQIAVVASVAGTATEAAIGFLDRLLFRERLNHFVLRFRSGFRRQHFLLDAREMREVRHVHAIQVEDDVDRNRARLQFFSAHHFVEIERDALAIADGIDDHQRLTGTDLSDVAGGEEVGVAEAAELVHLDGASLVFEFGGQPVERRTLSDSDDDIVHGKLLGLRFAINIDWRGVDCSLKLRRVQLQRFDLAVAEHGSHCAAMHQLHAFLEHVVQIFGRRPAFHFHCLRP